jgi:acid phosphatase type 7
VEAWKILQAANADIVLSGHDHHYERFAAQAGDGTPDPNGIREFVVGTGGTALYPVLMRRPNSQAVNNTNYGVLQLALRDKGYDWAFLSVDKDGFTDKGSANCH